MYSKYEELTEYYERCSVEYEGKLHSQVPPVLITIKWFFKKLVIFKYPHQAANLQGKIPN